MATTVVQRQTDNVRTAVRKDGVMECASKGTYGYGCNETCGACLNGNDSCSKTNGQCKDGCEEGWRDGVCKQVCKYGTYGYGCNETCGRCLNGNNSCSTLDGQCKEGCEAGWREGNCKVECDSGTYGPGCTDTCGKCLNGTSSCSKTDGQCMYGCENGWSGKNCKMVSSEKQTQMCPDVDARALGGSIGGICVIAIISNIITFVVLKKRMKKDTADSKVEMNVHILETSTGNDKTRAGIAIADALYEELQDRSRMSSSAYCKISEIK
ncbi:hypothetical protein CHS0354_031573 [Potamilus streckersoni]|uniref:Uncharacterized protein n=1 Tax=Potamilus streckersoni TaxID=2493646 RepID=A0AAE0TJ64_9BIVA|nr:hypothetical protein CHS0354_031573 [Potamilus streckersoni]